MGGTSARGGGAGRGGGGEGVFFFNDTATTEIYTLSLHDALPIYAVFQYLADSITLWSPTIRRQKKDIRTVQELLGHQSIKITMIYTHVMNKDGFGVRSPLD